MGWQAQFGYRVFDHLFWLSVVTSAAPEIASVRFLRVYKIQCISTEKETAMATTAMVHVRVDEQIKAQATETLAAMGLTVSDAVRVFLMRVVADKQMPFTLKVPNAETRAAMAEADEIARTRRARFGTVAELIDDLEKNSGN
ncbi:MAG TPA: type II toxin-antitoxin system RelB/DinJ family antitoxin [Rhodocyclaceae bacterium]|nr:type II toxin-antitoxin system RelB/DinJ family antitoxin [Rhodocyclaceae bacterium]